MLLPDGIDLETVNPENDNEIEIPDEMLQEAGIEVPTEESNETETTTQTDEGNSESDVEGQTEQEQAPKVEKTEKEKDLERALNRERKQRKEAQKKAKEWEDRIKALEEATKKPEKTTLETLIESGVEEGIAKSIASAIDNKKDNSKNLEKEIADLKFERSLSAKSKEEGFEDIEEYADEIKDFVEKGLTIEQAYHALSYDKPTSNTKREIERTIEAKMLNQNAKKEMLGNTNSNVGKDTSSKSKLNLSKNEYMIAQIAGMTPEEYAAMKNVNSNKDYTNYKKKK